MKNIFQTWKNGIKKNNEKKNLENSLNSISNLAKPFVRTMSSRIFFWSLHASLKKRNNPGKMMEFDSDIWLETLITLLSAYSNYQIRNHLEIYCTEYKYEKDVLKCTRLWRHKF